MVGIPGRGKHGTSACRRPDILGFSDASLWLKNQINDQMIVEQDHRTHTFWYRKKGDWKQGIAMSSSSGIGQIPWRLIHRMVLLMACRNRDRCFVASGNHWYEHRTASGFDLCNFIL
jgi:hypothetical protein